MSEQMASGFIGAGFMGRTHARAARSAGGRLAAVCSRTRRSADRLAAESGITAVKDDAEQLLSAADVDVVHVLTPNDTHASLASAALAAGKHVICEKPLATSVNDAAALVAQAEDLGLIAAVPFVYRYHPMVRQARGMVARGELGEILSVQASYLQDWLLGRGDSNWRVDAVQGGASRAFADIGSHACDLMEFILEDRIRRLVSTTRTVYADRDGQAQANTTEDLAAMLFRTGRDATGTLLVSQMAPGRKNALVIEVHGTEQSIRFEQEQPELLWVGQRNGSRLLLRDPGLDEWATARFQDLPAGHPLGYQDAFTAFVADVYRAANGVVPDDLPTFRDGLRSTVITEAVLTSAKTSEWVELPA